MNTTDNRILTLLSLLLLATASPSCGETELGSLPDNGLGGDGGTLFLDWGAREQPAFQACVQATRQATLPPLDMFIALDTSYSMDFKKKWTSVKAALKTFAGDSRFKQMGVGLQYFPLRAQCKVTDYASPAVGIAPLSSSATSLTSSLENQRMSGGTPMVPLLQGALQYTSAWAKKNPKRKVVILLATDGIPDTTCLSAVGGALPNTLANVVKVAASGLKQQPKVNTFVIGVGSELSSLDQISKAGGTGKAFLVDPTKDIQSAFLEALNDIRRTIACEFEIPEAPAREQLIDLTQILVLYTNSSGTTAFTQVKDQSQCASANGRGWYFDHPDIPTKITFCTDTCRTAQSVDDGKIEVKFGCKANPM